MQPPYRWEDAGWLANRWAGLLPMTLDERHRLMALDNPLLRLELVSDLLERILMRVQIHGANAVDPGGMRTDMRAAAYPEEDPQTRITPEENTGVFLYLASDESKGVTGQRFKAQEFNKSR